MLSMLSILMVLASKLKPNTLSVSLLLAILNRTRYNASVSATSSTIATIVVMSNAILILSSPHRLAILAMLYVICATHATISTINAMRIHSFCLM